MRFIGGTLLVTFPLGKARSISQLHNIAADLKAFAANVRAARDEAGMTQEAVADASGVHVTEVSRIERGLRDPRVSTMLRLAAALGVPASRLVDEKP